MDLDALNVCEDVDEEFRLIKVCLGPCVSLPSFSHANSRKLLTKLVSKLILTKLVVMVQLSYVFRLRLQP